MEVNLRFKVPTPFRLLKGGGLAVIAVVLALCAARDGALSAGTYSLTSPDTVGSVGSSSSIALDASGFPVVSYYNSGNGDLKIMHCNDANCAGADESITSPDTAGTAGNASSLVLDASGFPVVSYSDETNGDLKVMHCNDANCAGGNESITSPDTAGTVGTFTSLALDASGFPILAYQDSTNQDLKVMHCNDANCAGGGESVNALDTANNTGYDPSIALDESGFPVVSYKSGNNAPLRLLHCNDVNCAGGDESITFPDPAGQVGNATSLALDASGFPVVSYLDGLNADLKIMHCNDANCAGTNESITSPDTSTIGGFATSLKLDATGFPVVSYYDDGNDDLKVMHCNDVNCADGGEDVDTADSAGNVGQTSSLALDAAGFPVISYFDGTNSDLKVAHAGPKIMDVTIANIGQYALPKTCFEVRDANQIALFTVCDDDFQGAAASHAACVPDGVCGDEDSADGSVRLTLSSATYRLVESKAAPLHTADASNELCSTGAACGLTFVNTPSIRPWFPWDVTGDGAVAGTDIFQTIGHFAETK